MRLLFVHQNFGAFGGRRKQTFKSPPDELVQRGHTLAILYSQDTGRSTESWGSAHFQSALNCQGPGE